MTTESHRCSVAGCPNLAAYEVQRYIFDPGEGAVALLEDDTCEFICVEHAIDNELHARGERKPWAVVDYPYTNLNRLPGIALYVQLEPAYVA
jgi:hypothetical protein